MSDVLRVGVERPIEGLGGVQLVVGPALARNPMNGVARRLCVPILDSFKTLDLMDGAEFIRSVGMAVPGTVEPTREQWYPASDGLVTVRALLGHLSAEPNGRPNTAELVGDLRALEAVLSQLASANVRWHFEWDSAAALRGGE